jgi:hypothetical protein
MDHIHGIDVSWIHNTHHKGSCTLHMLKAARVSAERWPYLKPCVQICRNGHGLLTEVLLRPPKAIQVYSERREHSAAASYEVAVSGGNRHTEWRHTGEERGTRHPTDNRFPQPARVWSDRLKRKACGIRSAAAFTKWPTKLMVLWTVR